MKKLKNVKMLVSLILATMLGVTTFGACGGINSSLSGESTSTESSSVDEENSSEDSAVDAVGSIVFNAENMKRGG